MRDRDIKLYNEKKEILRQIETLLKKSGITRCAFNSIFGYQFSIKTWFEEVPVYKQTLVKTEKFNYKKSRNIRGSMIDFFMDIGMYLYNISDTVCLLTIYDYKKSRILQKYIVDIAILNDNDNAKYETNIKDCKFVYKDSELYMSWYSYSNDNPQLYGCRLVYCVSKYRFENSNDIYKEDYIRRYDYNKCISVKNSTYDSYILLDTNIPKKYTSGLYRSYLYLSDNKLVFVNRTTNKKMRHHYIFIHPIYEILENAFCDDISRIIWSFMYESAHKPFI